MASEGPVAGTIRAKLEAAFAPAQIDIIDESHLHAGHGGARPEGESHFRVIVVSGTFAGASRLERQRRVYDILAAEMAGPVHALSVSAKTPEEALNKGV